MPIHSDELHETMRRGLVGGQYGAVRNGIRYIEERVRDALMTAENGVEFLRSVRYDWTRVPCEIYRKPPSSPQYTPPSIEVVRSEIVRHPNPRYWALRQELTRATLRIAEGRRWDATQNRKPPLWNQCSLGDPMETPTGGRRPCHAFTFAKTRRRPGWTIRDAVREFRSASQNRYHGTGGTCAILAEEIAEIIAQGRTDAERHRSVKHSVFDTSEHALTIHALVTAARDRCVQRSQHSGRWMPSFQQYCRWWEQIFDVALYEIARKTKGA